MAQGEQRILTKLFVRTIAAVLVAGVAAAVIALRMPESYRARVLLIQSPRMLEQKDEVPGMVAAYQEATRRVSFVQTEMPEALPMPDYKLLFTSEVLASQVRDLLVEKYQAAGIDPGNLTMEKARRSLEVQSKLHLQTLEEIEYQQVVEMLLTAGDPGVAAETANAWAQMAIDLAERMRAVGREDTLRLVKIQLEEAWQRLDEAAAAMEELEKTANLDAMEGQLRVLEESATKARVRRAETVAEIAKAEKEQAVIESELAALGVGIPSGEGPGAVSRPALGDPAHAALRQRKAVASASLAALRAEREALQESIAELEAGAQALRAEVAQVRRKHTALELKVQTAAKNVDELSVTEQATRIAAADTEPDFHVASPAMPPEEKIWPHRSLIVLVAMFLAGAAVPVHLFGMVALRRYARAVESDE